MTAIAEAPGPTINWTPITQSLPYLICSGIGIVAGTAVGLDAANVEGYDMHIFNEPTVVTFPSEVQPIDTPGYGGETIPDLNISFTKGVSMEEGMHILGELIKSGDVEAADVRNGIGITVPPDADVDEIIRMIADLENGKSMETVLASAPNDRVHGGFLQAFLTFKNGHNFVLIKHDLSSGLKFSNGQIQLITKTPMN